MSATKHYLETFIQQYAETLLWVSPETDDEGNPFCLSDEYSVLDLTPETWETIELTCANFLEHVWLEIPECAERSASDMAHNFALSRNGHGVGFWDRGWGLEGDALHACAKSFGEQNLYVGDDDKVYID